MITPKLPPKVQIDKHIPTGYVIRGYTEKEMVSYALEFSLEYNKQLTQKIVELESIQVKQGKTPMTDEQVLAIGKELGKKCRLGGNPNIDFDYARAIEAYHGIK